ncbi:MAG TPA: cysteine hydrolase family protein [Bacteroidales bacterium]|nr:cysteine hydrolase family protein [Bacteroidales bacterium]
MKKYLIFGMVCVAAFLISGNSYSQGKIKIRNDSLPTALILVDIQDFYFPGGQLPLVNPEAASEKAAALLKMFRDQRLPVIHVQHAGGSPIHANVAPKQGEKVITKTEANGFNNTDLLDYLKFLGVKRLVICGMQTHMCVEATTRAAYDYGFRCIVVQDACATRDLKWGDRVIKAADVHASTLASLQRYYGIVVNADDLE